jgi:hypothetical protein
MTVYFICERCHKQKARSNGYRQAVKKICATCRRRLIEGGHITRTTNNAKKAAQRLENPIPPAPSRGIDS